jgi:hypothetical protein
LRLTVHVKPKAASDSIAGWSRDTSGRRVLQVRVRALPEDGAANAAVCALVAEWLGLAKSQVSVVTGHKSRTKALSIDAGAARSADIEERLNIERGKD